MNRPGPQGSPRMGPRNGSPSLSPAYMPHPSAIPDPQRYSTQSPNHRSSEYRNSSSSPRRNTRSYNDPSYSPQGGNRLSYADPASANRQSTHNPNAGSGVRRTNPSGSETSSGRQTTSSGGHRQPSPNSQNRNSTRPRPSANGYGGSGPHPAQSSAYRQRDPESGYMRQNLNRQRSLTRPERQRQRAPMIRDGLDPIEDDVPTSPQRRKSLARQPRPGQQREMSAQRSAQRSAQPSQQILQQAQAAKKSMVKPKQKLSWWAILAKILTCCCPNWCMRVCCKMGDSLVQQAWREKVALCYIILFCCSCLAFLTFALRDALCPDQRTLFPYSSYQANGKLGKAFYKNITVYGEVYPFDVMQRFFQTVDLNLPVDYQSTDMSAIFDADTNNDCLPYDQGYTNGTTLVKCIVNDPYGGWIQQHNFSCISFTRLRNFYKADTSVSFDWSDVAPNSMSAHPNLLVYGDTVLNITNYLNSGSYYFGYNTHIALTASRGLDGSSLLTRYPESLAATKCLLARYSVGVISSQPMGCVASDLITDFTLVVIVGLIFVRFTMAVIFQWFISSSLVKPGGRSGILAWRSQAGGNYAPENERPSSIYSGVIPTASSSSLGNTSTASGTMPSPLGPNHLNSSMESVSVANTPIGADIVKTKMYTTMLVTCYSEGEASLRTTLDSLAATTYSTKHKLFFIIADGIITGSGNDRSTPDICISMLTLDPTMADPAPCTYMAVADGEKQLNMAKVYAGHYKYNDLAVPAILVVKAGTPAEQKGTKSGNRGKRDSQLILMSFFQRILFNDRLTELDYELFWKITWLMRGVTPDKFELVLMVDADTKVLPDSLTYMVAAMVNDITIMGLCGETRIANKKTSWVTGIQVFEYYISHHYAKAFESVFGGVTCLPGCFCMYRIKAPKNGAWVPILANPDIVLEYNQNVVTTLHAKNLLLLGEDRFLSTLMLRTFPKRQMMFVPQARCKTVVPDSFSVLLSQRRRWINSTVHNLMELVLVSDLCGIACLSMQFAVFLELIGTIVLPAAICFTLWLIIDTIITSNPQVEPLIILAAILGLPALLIVLTTRKMVYVLWMFVYLAALPVWNFILPVYSFWHFDDFSWGQTRKVAGEVKGHDHSNPEGEFDSSQIVMKKWEEWERERLGQKKFKAVRTNLKTPTDFASAGKSDDISLAPSLSAAYGNRKMFGSPTNVRNSIATPSSILLHPDNSYRASSYMPQGAPGAPDTRRFSGALQNNGSRGSLSIPGSSPQMTAYQRQSAASPIPMQTLANRSSTSIGSASDGSSFIGAEPVNIQPAQHATQRSSQLPLLAQQQGTGSYSSSQSYEMQSQQAAANLAAAGQGQGYHSGYGRQSNDDDNTTLVSSTSTTPHVHGAPVRQRSESSELLDGSEGGDVRLPEGMEAFERGRRREEEEEEEEEYEEEEGPR